MDQGLTIMDAVQAAIGRRKAALAEIQRAEFELAEAGVTFKDGPHGTTWAYSKVLVPEEPAALK